MRYRLDALIVIVISEGPDRLIIPKLTLILKNTSFKFPPRTLLATFAIGLVHGILGRQDR
jgi:hypothetical protein